MHLRLAKNAELPPKATLTRLIHQCATYVVRNLHSDIICLSKFFWLTKDAESFLQGRPGLKEERYIKGKRAKNKESTVFLSVFVSFSLFPHFLSWPPLWDNSLPEESYRSERYYISYVVNFSSSSRCSPFQRGDFLTNTQQKSFYVYWCTFSIFKLFAILEVRVK